jgi:Ser/Thr protein kinase RdoA (MazF antagonist)
MKPALMAQKFDVAGRLVTIMPQGSGNVNDTYLAIFRTTFSEERFILQRINHKVFARPEDIMANMRIVTEHVHTRLEEEADTADRIWQLPRIIPSKDGGAFVRDDEGNYWRAISLIASAHSYEQVQNLKHAYEAGYVLGQFQRLLSDISPDLLFDTLEGFHITPGYLKELDNALATNGNAADIKGISEVNYCLKFIDERREFCSVLEDAKERGELKIRPIHGDPKIANIMIDDATDKGTCIVDLDTVKPGLIQYDFGDCLRSACNRAGEETLDLGSVHFDIELCDIIIKGYMKFARRCLTDADINYLYDSIRLITFELGLRFFTDYILGNKYFKVQSEEQNLNRARVQFRLCESIENNERKIRQIITKYTK